MMIRKKIFVFTWLLAISLVYSCKSDDTVVMEEQEEVPSEFMGQVSFISTFGGTNIDEAIDVVQANDGGYVVLGTTNSNDGDVVDKTSTDFDLWVLKISLDGTIIWSKTYGGTQDDNGTSIAKTSDGGYIISAYSRSGDGDVSGNEGFHDYWILKLDSSGEKQWDQNFGFSGSDQAFDVIQTNDGGYFATGFLDVTASNGQGNEGRATLHGVGEFWGIKMDASGTMEWRRFFGGSNNDRSYMVLQTVDNGFLLGGASESDDFDITDSRGSYDFWLVRIDNSGNMLWTKSFGGSEIDIAYAMTHTDDGNYLIVGDARSTDMDVSNPKGNADVWVVKIDDTGNMIWEKSYGGNAFESARDVINLSNNNYAIVSSTRSEQGDITVNNGLNDAWVIVINETGAIQYEKTIGGSELDFAVGVMETLNNELVIVGNTESNDLDIAENKGVKDFLIVKIE